MVSSLYGSARVALVCKHEEILCHKLSSDTPSSLWLVLVAQEVFLLINEPSFFQSASFLHRGEEKLSNINIFNDTLVKGFVPICE